MDMTKKLAREINAGDLVLFTSNGQDVSGIVVDLRHYDLPSYQATDVRISGYPDCKFRFVNDQTVWVN